MKNVQENKTIVLRSPELTREQIKAYESEIASLYDDLGDANERIRHLEAVIRDLTSTVKPS